MSRLIVLLTLVLYSFLMLSGCGGGSSGDSGDNDAENIMIFVEGGTFIMGSPDTEANRWIDETQHEVTVGSFYMSEYEVTQKEWVAVMGSNPSYFVGDDLPVEQVTWYDAVEYCNARSIKEGLAPAYTIDKATPDSNNQDASDSLKWTVTLVFGANGYRLPTEAEWEYAARAGTTTPFSTGNNITTDQANYDGNHPYDGNPTGVYRNTTTAVGSFAPNVWGLYDMNGNVWEWVWDWYDGDYETTPQIDPTGAVSGTSRLTRGGSWISYALFLRSAHRGWGVLLSGSYKVGFRVVRS